MSSSSDTSPRFRVAPSPWVAAVVVVVYVVAVFGLQLSTGIEYAEWTSTVDNGIRAALIPLAVGAAVVLGFAVWSRWDMLWRDPRTLELTTAMKVALWFFVLAIVAKLVATSWADVELPLLMVILGIGVLVGFAEEMLFRGIVLRSLRTGGRDEARAALWTAVAFGLFHAPNLLVAPATQAGQVVVAALTGVSLYVFRRYRGMIVVAMVAHGTWDVASFLAGVGDSVIGDVVNVALLPVGVIIGIVALVSIWRHDQDVVVASDRETASA